VRPLVTALAALLLSHSGTALPPPGQVTIDGRRVYVKSGCSWSLTAAMVLLGDNKEAEGKAPVREAVLAGGW